MNGNGTTKTLAVGAVVGLVGVVATSLVSGWERFWVNWIIWILFLLTIGLGCLFSVLACIFSDLLNGSRNNTSAGVFVCLHYIRSS